VSKRERETERASESSRHMCEHNSKDLNVGIIFVGAT